MQGLGLPPPPWTRHEMIEFLHTHRTVISASSASIVGTVAGYPFDSVKTRMQTFAYPSLAHCVKQTYSAEGLRGFFRGMVPPLLTVSFIKSAAFSVYVHYKTVLSQYTAGDPRHSASALLAVSMGGGVFSGAFTAVLTQPLELIKVLRQLQELISKEQHEQMVAKLPAGTPAPPPEKVKRLATWGIGREIVRMRGFTGLYYGFNSHLFRESLGSAMYFASYELSKYGLTKASGAEPNVMIHLMAGGICGTMSWMVIFPADVIKSSIQKDALLTNPRYHGFRQCATSLYQQGGFRIFYRGISATLFRAAPIHSLNWVVYEGVLRLCTKPG